MEIHLDRDATLIAWDAVSAGRVARGERFAFDGLYVGMRIFRDNLPEVVDGFDLYAGGEPFGGYLHVGAAYVLAPRDLEPLAEKLHGRRV
jgi:urease accessory protein